MARKKQRISRAEVSRVIESVRLFDDSMELSVGLFQFGRALDAQGEYADGYLCKESAVSLQGMFATMERMRAVIIFLAKTADLPR